MYSTTYPAAAYSWISAAKFGPGSLAPLSVVIRSEKGEDLRESEGLALIDDVSRLLSRSRHMVEVRSATQPLGSAAALAPARLGARLGAVNAGFGRMADGAEQLHAGLLQGVQRLRAGILLEALVR